MDQKTQLELVIGGVVVCSLLIYRKTLKKFILKIGKGGLLAELHAEPEANSHKKGVDLSRAKFKDENEFSASEDARVKAIDLEVGSKNKIKIGRNDAGTKRELN